MGWYCPLRDLRLQSVCIIQNSIPREMSQVRRSCSRIQCDQLSKMRIIILKGLVTPLLCQISQTSPMSHTHSLCPYFNSKSVLLLHYSHTIHNTLPISQYLYNITHQPFSLLPTNPIIPRASNKHQKRVFMNRVPIRRFLIPQPPPYRSCGAFWPHVPTHQHFPT